MVGERDTAPFPGPHPQNQQQQQNQEQQNQEQQNQEQQNQEQQNQEQQNQEQNQGRLHRRLDTPFEDHQVCSDSL